MNAVKQDADFKARIEGSISGTFKGLTVKNRLNQGGVVALQAICSASIAYWVGRILHVEQAIWAVLTAIAVTQQRYADTVTQCRDQFIGAMVGGGLGFVGAALGAGHFVAYAITVVAVILSCWCLNLGGAARLGATTATIVLLFPGNGPLWDIPLLRLGEVTLGTVSAISVSWLISHAERLWSVRL